MTNVEKVKAQLYEKLNKAVDDLAVEHGMTRNELLQTARDFLKKVKNNTGIVKKDEE